MPLADSQGSPAQERQKKDQTFNYPQHLEDNIDLYELWITIWKTKWLLIIFSVIAFFGSCTYALQLQLIYKAETLLLNIAS